MQEVSRSFDSFDAVSVLFGCLFRFISTSPRVGRALRDPDAKHSNGARSGRAYQAPARFRPLGPSLAPDLAKIVCCSPANRPFAQSMNLEFASASESELLDQTFLNSELWILNFRFWTFSREQPNSANYPNRFESFGIYFQSSRQIMTVIMVSRGEPRLEPSSTARLS